MKFSRTGYGAVAFKRSGIRVSVYRPTETLSSLIPIPGDGSWAMNIGGNVYTGFASRRAAIEAVGQFIL